MGKPYKESALDRRVLVSVVIVNYNGGPLVEQGVRAALQSTVPVQIIVCDNGSTDGSLGLLRTLARDHPPIRLIELGRNRGFTYATNAALRQAAGQYLLLLNPDCIVRPETLARMVMTLQDHPEAGMAGCLIRNPDGSEQVGCRRAVPTPWRSLVRVGHLDRLNPNHPRLRTFLLNNEPLPEKPVPVEAISGAFMLVRREAMEQVGLLDEGYFLHCEDLDWCMRLRREGWQVLFVPDVEVVHYKGGCSGGRTLFVEWHKHKGMVRFYRKFFRHQYPWPLMGLVLVGVWARFAAIAGVTLARRVTGRAQRHDGPARPAVAAINAPATRPAPAGQAGARGESASGPADDGDGAPVGDHGDPVRRAGGAR